MKYKICSLFSLVIFFSFSLLSSASVAPAEAYSCSCWSEIYSPPVKHCDEVYYEGNPWDPKHQKTWCTYCYARNREANYNYPTCQDACNAMQNKLGTPLPLAGYITYSAWEECVTPACRGQGANPKCHSTLPDIVEF
jgi:hypothetical protein